LGQSCQWLSLGFAMVWWGYTFGTLISHLFSHGLCIHSIVFWVVRCDGDFIVSQDYVSITCNHQASCATRLNNDTYCWGNAIQPPVRGPWSYLFGYSLYGDHFYGILQNGSVYRWTGPDAPVSPIYTEGFNMKARYTTVQRGVSRDCYVTKLGASFCTKMGDVEALAIADLNVTLTISNQFGATYQTGVCVIIDGEVLLYGKLLVTLA
jgi:hypothetical protein